MAFTDPFGLKRDTTFVDNLARAQTRECIAESVVCARVIGALAADSRTWTIQSGSFKGNQTGETNTEFTKDGKIAGGTITIDGNLMKYSAVSEAVGYNVTYRSTLVHEGGHAVDNILLERTGRVTEDRNCDKACTVQDYDNPYRREIGLGEIELK